MLNRFLNWIEAAGNRLPDPLFLYAGMAGLVLVISALAAGLGWQQAHPVTGETLRAVSLLTPDNLQRLFTEAVPNFITFPPLGTVLVTMIGIGLAERSGLIGTGLQLMVRTAPQSLLSGIVVFAGVMSSMAADAGYVVLVPLGAVIFAGLGRHPLAGLCAAFAGVGGGFSANLLLTSLDPLLSGLTLKAAQLYDPEYVVQPDANYYFLIVSTFLVTGLGWWVTEQIVEPRLGQWDPAHAEDGVGDDGSPAEPGPTEKRGFWAALGTFAAVVAVAAALTVPADGLFRGPDGGLGPFYEALIPLLALAFALPGIVYGLIVGSIRSTRSMATMLTETMATMGGYIVLIFVIAQFVAYFQWSNLGILLAISGASGLQALGIGDIPLMLAFVVLAAFINLVIGSASGKWGVMATVFVPMFMILGMSPELTQATYRVGDSVTNIITPLNPYFAIILSFALRYDRRIGIGTLTAAMLPYSIAFGLGWTVLLVLWYLLGLPLGPGAPLSLPGGG
ncbi:MAG: AbgT family transporter [Opitutales bacterium]